MQCIVCVVCSLLDSDRAIQQRSRKLKPCIGSKRPICPLLHAHIHPKSMHFWARLGQRKPEPLIDMRNVHACCAQDTIYQNWKSIIIMVCGERSRKLHFDTICSLQNSPHKFNRTSFAKASNSTSIRTVRTLLSQNDITNHETINGLFKPSLHRCYNYCVDDRSKSQQKNECVHRRDDFNAPIRLCSFF